MKHLLLALPRWRAENEMQTLMYYHLLHKQEPILLVVW